MSNEVWSNTHILKHVWRLRCFSIYTRTRYMNFMRILPFHLIKLYRNSLLFNLRNHDRNILLLYTKMYVHNNNKSLKRLRNTTKYQISKPLLCNTLFAIISGIFHILFNYILKRCLKLLKFYAINRSFKTDDRIAEENCFIGHYYCSNCNTLNFYINTHQS